MTAMTAMKSVSPTLPPMIPSLVGVKAEAPAVSMVDEDAGITLMVALLDGWVLLAPAEDNKLDITGGAENDDVLAPLARELLIVDGIFEEEICDLSLLLPLCKADVKTGFRSSCKEFIVPFVVVITTL